MKAGWTEVSLGDLVDDQSRGHVKTKQGDYLDEGVVPIVDQGARLVGGFTDDLQAMSQTVPPVIIFGDHTRCVKYVDFPFGAGADGIKVLKPSAGVDARFAFRSIQIADIPNLGYSRHFKYLKEMRFALPPIEEQRRIAAVLDAADALRAKRRQAIAKLDTLTQAIFIDMFGDPVSNPMGWPTVCLSETGSLDRGVSTHRPRNDPVLLGGQWPLVQTGDVANSGGTITCHSSTYSDVGLAQSRLWPTGTLCITIAANIAKTAFLSFDACFPDSVVGFDSPTVGMASYVDSYLSFLQPILERQAPESAQKNINLRILRELVIARPPDVDIALYSSRVQSVGERKASLVKESERLDNLFASLQQQAFRGEL